jgi:hypothetical protein
MQLRVSVAYEYIKRVNLNRNLFVTEPDSTPSQNGKNSLVDDSIGVSPTAEIGDFWSLPSVDRVRNRRHKDVAQVVLGTPSGQHPL